MRIPKTLNSMPSTGTFEKEFTEFKSTHKKIIEFKSKMDSMILVNCSNHHSSGWGQYQIEACNIQPGFNIIDVQFPNVDPEMDEKEIEQLAEKTINTIFDSMIPAKMEFLQQFKSKFNNERIPNFSPMIHVAGEPTLVAALNNKIINITVSATTKRETVINPDGSKISKFNFVRFRKFTK